MPLDRGGTRGSTLSSTSGSRKDWKGSRRGPPVLPSTPMRPSRARMPQGETTATWHTTFTGMAATMNVLTIARQFPNDQQPNYGVFVENRIARLAKDGQLSFRVLAPVAWVPFGRRLQGRLARFGRIASQAARAGYIVDHPRYCVIPKLGFPLAPFFLYLGLTRHIRQLMKQGYTFDFID